MSAKLSSLALTPSLFILAIACFFWGNNAHMYQPDSLAASVLVLVVIAVFVAAIGLMARGLWNKLGLDKYWTARLLAGLLIGGLTVAIFNVILRALLRSMMPTEFARDFFRGIVLFAFLPLLFFRLRHVVRALNIFLMASICLSIFMVASVSLEDNRETAGLDADLPATLEKTPNIYMFWLESFHEPRVIDKNYDMTLVRDGFPDDLQKRGFQYFKETYSNNASTLLSMADFFSMKPGQDREAGLLDASLQVRRLLAGGNENRVLRILKNSGYFTAFINNGSQFFAGGSMGEHLDSTDFVIANGSLQYYLRPFLELLRSGTNDWWFDTANGYSGNLHEDVQHAMQLAKNHDKPLFISFKGGAGHSDQNKYSYAQNKEWVSKYQELVRNAVSQTVEIVDMIVAKDPEAVIILMGDHGAWRLRGLWEDADLSDTSALSAQLQQNNESLESLVDDLFNVMLAIRIPGYEDDISHGLPMTTVNVFRHVIAALNDDPAILESRQPSISTYNRMTLVVDGKAVQE